MTQSEQPNIPSVQERIRQLRAISARLKQEREDADPLMTFEVEVDRRIHDRVRLLLLGRAGQGDTLRDVRALVAVGILAWNPRPEICDVTPDDFDVETFAIASLAPLIQARRLPFGWKKVFLSLTSEPVFNIVRDLRRGPHRQNIRLLRVKLVERVAKDNIAEGLQRLVEDFCDGDRGARILNALIGVSPETEPRTRQPSLSQIASFVLTAALGGVIGNRVDAQVVDTVRKMQSTTQELVPLSPTVPPSQPPPVIPTPVIPPPLGSRAWIRRIVGVFRVGGGTDPTTFDRYKYPLAAVVVALLGLGGGGVAYVTAQRAPTPTQATVAVIVATQAPTPTDTAIPTATHTSTPTDTAIPTATHTPTNTQRPTDTPTTTSTNSPTPTQTPIPPTNTPVPPTPVPPTPVPPTPVPPTPVPPTSFPGEESREAEMVALMNSYRQSIGCNIKLERISSLTTAARRHSIDMATNNFVEHDGTDGSTSQMRAKDAGFNNLVMEDAAAGYSDAQSTLNAWLDDEPHRVPIANCDHNVVGVGYAYAESSTYKHYWVAVMSTR